MQYYLFPKLFQHLSLGELMSLCKKLDIDGPTALIREGYWIERETLKTALPKYVKAAQADGLRVTYAETPFSLSEIPSLGHELELFRENGITDFRVDFISKRCAGAYRDLPGYLRPLIEKAAETAGKAGVRMIIQLHGHCYPHNATAAYPLVCGLDPAAVGIKIDPGNNFAQEGYELLDYQVELLGEYIAAVGAKDALVARSGDPQSSSKGWVRAFSPAYEGMTDYPLLYRELKKIGFKGPAILMPFYHDENYDRLCECLKQEIAYFRWVERQTS